MGRKGGRSVAGTMPVEDRATAWLVLYSVGWHDFSKAEHEGSINILTQELSLLAMTLIRSLHKRNRTRALPSMSPKL